jgi:site-specific recombinase XerD
MTAPKPLGPIIHSFFIDHLVTVKGLRPASVRSYRDTIRLLLCFVAEDKGSKITKLTVDDLSFERVLGFLRHLEDDRGNHVRTRNQRLAILHTLFEYIPSREPEMLVCQRVAAIPSKRAAPAETHFLERDEMEATVPWPSPDRSPRSAGSRLVPLPLQHRGAGAGGRRPASRTT